MQAYIAEEYGGIGTACANITYNTEPALNKILVVLLVLIVTMMIICELASYCEQMLHRSAR